MKPNLAKEEGHLFTETSSNSKKILRDKNAEMFRNHKNSAWHKNTIAYLQKQEAQKIEKAFSQAQKVASDLCKDLTATMNFFLSVFASTIMNIPLHQFPVLMQLQTLTGGKIGKHHHNRMSATKAMIFMADLNHRSRF